MVFLSDTVKSDCPVQIFRKKMEYIKIKVYLTSFTVFFSGDIKKIIKKLYKKKLKKTSENDQLTGHFQSFLIYFFSPPTLSLKKNSSKSTNKKIWPNQISL